MGTSRPYALRPLLNPEHMRVGLANASARRKRWSKSHARITPGSIHQRMGVCRQRRYQASTRANCTTRSEEHTSELQSQSNLVCRLLLEKKKISRTTPESTQ